MKSLKFSPNAMVDSRRDYYPSLSISTKAIPELADMKDGDTCTITLTVKKTGSYSDNNETKVNLDAISGEYAEDKSEKKEEYDA